ncbi:MAG: hypothetical protein HYV63_03590 [Candidatus Schekmanbacteria bacterium]|nr:hypothetical protein [Candidatus Schekmanbacteria bacterium]
MLQCLTCKDLQDREWQEWLHDTDWAPDPPPFQGLQPVGAIPRDDSSRDSGYDLPLRCGGCGAWYVYRCKAGELYLNQCLWTFSFRRLSTSEAAAPWIRTRWLASEGKISELGGLLLESGAGDATQREALETLMTLALSDCDLTPVEPLLRKLLAGSVELRGQAARVLSFHLLRAGRYAEATSLLTVDDPAVESGAHAGLAVARNHLSESQVKPCFAELRRLAPENERARILLEKTRAFRLDDADTVAEVLGELPGADPKCRSSLVWFLGAAAARGMDISPALPHLIRFLDDEDSSVQLQAITAIARCSTAAVSPFVPALCGHLGAHLNDSSTLDIVHVLRRLQDESGDISPTFEKLARAGGRAGAWPLTLLMRAAESGADVSSAVAALRRRLRGQSWEAGMASGILTHCFARSGAWAELAATLRSKHADRASCATILADLASRLDLAPLVPVLRELAGAGEDGTRKAAAAALDRILRADSGLDKHA